MRMLTRKMFKLVLFLFAIGVSSISLAGESSGKIKDPIAHGKQAHENHCYKCHSDDIYTREDRFVKSIDALSKQVVRCKEGNDIPWFDEDADAVVQFLNKKYYRF